MTLGEKLKNAREAAGLSIRQAATQLDYKSHGIIQQWENGSRYPKLEKLKKLAQLYEIDIAELI